MKSSSPYIQKKIYKTLKECELLTNLSCVCNFSSVLLEAERLISNFEEHRSLTIPQDIDELTCDSYVPIGENLLLDHKKIRKIYTKPKQLIIDDGPGPKVITNDTIKAIILKDLPCKVSNIYAFPKSSLSLICFNGGVEPLMINDRVNYSWEFKNKAALSEGRISESSRVKGALHITDLNFWDTGNYTCKTSFTDPDSEEKINDAFNHVLTVVTIPKLVLSVGVRYETKGTCDEEVLELMEIMIPQELESKICIDRIRNKQVCQIEIFHPICRGVNRESSVPVNPSQLWTVVGHSFLDPEKYHFEPNISEKMEMQLCYELRLRPLEEFMNDVSEPDITDTWTCGPHCRLKIALKLLNILRESFMSTINLPLVSGGAEFKPKSSYTNGNVVIACDGGLQLSEGLCVPCERDTYSEDGSTKCTPCPYGHYQDRISSRSCFQCPHPLRRGCFHLMYKLSSIIGISILGPFLSYLAAVKVKQHFWESGISMIAKKVLVQDYQPDSKCEEKMKSKELDQEEERKIPEPFAFDV